MKRLKLITAIAVMAVISGSVLGGCKNKKNDSSDTLLLLALLQPTPIYIGGTFTSYNGSSMNRIGRLDDSGSRDASFSPVSGPNGSVHCIISQADRKIIIAGAFTSYNGTSCGRIARLNTDGSFDSTFNSGGSGADSSEIRALIRDGSGKIYIGGTFTQYNGSSRPGIARLNENGSLDTTFTPGSGANDCVYGIGFQSDGKVIIGGAFTSVNGTTRQRVARLNANGSHDTTFGTVTGANAVIYSLSVQSNDMIIIGGDFTNYSGTSRNRIARLESDGSIDTGFDPGTGANGWVNTVALQSDGKIVLGGAFSTYDDETRQNLARINSNGSIDTAFDSSTGADNIIEKLAVQPDGRVLIAGWFKNYAGTSRNYIARVNSDGSLDTSFDPGTGTNSRLFCVIK